MENPRTDTVERRYPNGLLLFGNHLPSVGLPDPPGRGLAALDDLDLLVDLSLAVGVTLMLALRHLLAVGHQPLAVDVVVPRLLQRLDRSLLGKPSVDGAGIDEHLAVAGVNDTPLHLASRLATGDAVGVQPVRVEGIGLFPLLALGRLALEDNLRVLLRRVEVGRRTPGIDLQVALALVVDGDGIDTLLRGGASRRRSRPKHRYDEGERHDQSHDKLAHYFLLFGCKVAMATLPSE